MKMFFLSLFFLPFLYNGKNRTNPGAVKYTNEKSNTIEAPGANHARWNTLLQKNVLKNGNVNYRGFQKDSK